MWPLMNFRYWSRADLLGWHIERPQPLPSGHWVRHHLTFRIVAALQGPDLPATQYLRRLADRKGCGARRGAVLHGHAFPVTLSLHTWSSERRVVQRNSYGYGQARPDAASNATLLVVPGQHDSFADEAGLNEQVLAWLAGTRSQKRLRADAG